MCVVKTILLLFYLTLRIRLRIFWYTWIEYSDVEVIANCIFLRSKLSIIVHGSVVLWTIPWKSTWHENSSGNATYSFWIQRQDISVPFYVHVKNNYAAINNSSKIDPFHPTLWELSPEYCNVNTSLWNAAWWITIGALLGGPEIT